MSGAAADADPDVQFPVYFDLERPEEPPPHLNGYAIWKPVSQAPRSKEFVWRVEEPLGYGRRPDEAGWFSGKRKEYLRKPEIVVIDDAGLGIRFDKTDEEDNKAWPEALTEPQTEPQTEPWVVLKMARPLAQGALWDKLRDFQHRLTVIVSIDDIRRAPVRVTKGISWERTALDLADELTSNDDIKALLKCRHLIINMRSEGALLVSGDLPDEPEFTLIFDPEHLEGEWESSYEGTVFGLTSGLTAAVVVELARPRKASEQPDLERGIKSGLAGIRKLFLEGHGPAIAENPGPKFALFAREALNPTVTYQSAILPKEGKAFRNSDWSIIADAERRLRRGKRPLYGIAKGIALTGTKALSHVPHGRFGKLLTVDRNEIEALRCVHQLIKEYIEHDPGTQPLSLAVFGPPGSGKSFAVKQIAKMVTQGDAKPLEFNLSQFEDASDLIGAFHQIRDRALEGTTPFVFWDEFDSLEYYWLRYLLAPMQDGKFQEGQITHPIGKAVFVFAGGTAYTMKAFGPRDPADQSNGAPKSAEDRKEAQTKWDEFKLRKGPDFKSRIAGFLDVLGPNQRQRGAGQDDTDHKDIYFPVRRALFVRSVMGLLAPGREEERLDIDRGLLAALLEAPRYTHGSRSLQKLIHQTKERSGGGLTRSGLPAPRLLDLFVQDSEDEEERTKRGFLDIMEKNRVHPVDLEELAAAIHEYWWERSKKEGWDIGEELNRPYEGLEEKWKRDNRAAAVRIPEVLELAGLYLERDHDGKGSDQIVRDVIEHYLELLAEAEHDGWHEHRRKNGWTRGKRDNKRKRHPSMKPYRELGDLEKKKDRDAVTAYPDILASIKYRIAHSRYKDEES